MGNQFFEKYFLLEGVVVPKGTVIWWASPAATPVSVVGGDDRRDRRGKQGSSPGTGAPSMSPWTSSLEEGSSFFRQVAVQALVEALVALVEAAQVQAVVLQQAE
jgi:hypothetical protein